MAKYNPLKIEQSVPELYPRLVQYVNGKFYDGNGNLINITGVAINNPSLYNLIISELPREFEEKFKKPETIVRMSKDDFYKVVASLIRQKKVYASEYDIAMVKFILDKCDNPIFLNMIHNQNESIRKKNI